MTYHARLLMDRFVTHDTREFVVSRPHDLTWKPGQGVELAIDSGQWRDQGRPFTPVSRPQDQVLAFVIKRYPRDGVTQALHAARPGSALTLSDAFGTIRYQGPGMFIAAGTGVTPFLAILRDLETRDALAGHGMLFSNKSERDLICGAELDHLLGDRLVLTFTRQQARKNGSQHVDTAFLRAHIHDVHQHFYVCGPPGFVASVNAGLAELGVDPHRLVYEQ